MPEQLALHTGFRRLARRRVEFADAADVVQHGRGDHQPAVEGRVQFGERRRVPVREPRARPRDGQRVFEPAAGERVVVPGGAGERLERGRVRGQHVQHQRAEGQVRDLAGRERFEVREHGLRVVPRPLGEVEFGEPVGAVAVGDGADLFDVELRAVLVVFEVGRPHLEELPDVPLLGLLEQRRVGPNGHGPDGAAGVAVLAGEERVAVAGGAAGLLGELHEAIDVVAGPQVGQLRQHRLLGFGHGVTHGDDSSYRERGEMAMCESGSAPSCGTG